MDQRAEENEDTEIGAIVGERKVLLRFGDGKWEPPATSGYVSESALQHLLAEEPTLLPGVKDGARAVREFGLRVGPADVIVVGEGGDLTIVECKLASNDEARRKIVGQVFDYAARLWKMPVEEFEERWIGRSGAPFSSWLAPEGRDQLEVNLSEGRFRLILAVDSISVDLQRLVEYLNAQTLQSMQVLAIELSIAKTNDVEILIPRVYGQELAESAARTQPGQSSPSWTVEDVTSWFATKRPDLSAGIMAFLDRLRSIPGCLLIGTSAQTPSLAVAVDTPDGRMWPYALFSGAPKPSLNINFAYLSKAGEPGQEEFLRQVHKAIPILAADEIRSAGYRKRPGVDTKVLTGDGVIDSLAQALEGLNAGSPPLPAVSDELGTSFAGD